MPSASILRRPLFTLLPLALLLASAIAAHAQTVINHVPYTITVAGDYVLGSNLNSSQTSGVLITINAGNVTLDLQGHYLSGPVSGTNNVDGIIAQERANVTIRNGTVAHCHYGINLEGNGGSTTNNLNHILDSLRVSHCDDGIILDYAPGSTVTNCKFTQISSSGVLVHGPGSTVQGCVLSQIGSVGVLLDAGSFALQNSISNAPYGVLYGLYKDNVASGCATPFAYGTDGGGNASN